MIVWWRHRVSTKDVTLALQLPVLRTMVDECFMIHALCVFRRPGGDRIIGVACCVFDSDDERDGRR